MSSSNPTQENDSNTERNLNEPNNFGQQQIPPNGYQFTHFPQPQSSQSQQLQSFNSPNNWVYVSEDRIKSNNQQLDVFWESVLDAFNEFCQEDGESVERTASYLKNHWSDMNRGCKVYGTYLKSVMQGPISGIKQEYLDDAAKAMYEARGKGKWSYKDAYEVLSAYQCWKIL
ncbi:hypothetical protein GIB67_015949 [Kingdonia uniflora]|uniref:Uncharacterized protein n=1 Tax=Kingdonia uniflora TaxID=39325 RepID=A0A7J7PDS6_9MAGN|nr:hypothetical protein GIB67_015949 [Kingdonia uniflora]